MHFLSSQIQDQHTYSSIQYCLECKSHGSAVGIATGYGLDNFGVGVQVLVGLRILTSPYCPDRLWGPPSLLSNGYLDLSHAIRSEHEADHSPLTSAEVKKTLIYTSTPQYVFMEQSLIS
jgi:hypothetical protein